MIWLLLEKQVIVQLNVFLKERSVLVCSILDFMLIVEIYEILNKSLKSCQELNNKIMTRDVYLAIIYIKVTVEILNVVGFGKGEKKQKERSKFHARERLIYKTHYIPIRNRSLKRSQESREGRKLQQYYNFPGRGVCYLHIVQFFSFTHN